MVSKATISKVKKNGVVAIIFLFIFVAFAPSIHANINKDSELVEITTEICGLPGQKPQTVKPSKSDADAVDELFDEIKIRLDNVKSWEETVEIFNEAVVELDKYGLFGKMGVKQAQKLITEKYQKSNIARPFDRLNDRNFENTNWHCLIVGETTYTSFNGILWRVLASIAGLLSFIPSTLLQFLAIMIGGLLIPIEGLNTQIQPFLIGAIIDFGINTEGWVKTTGLLGEKSWDGTLVGGLRILLAGDIAVVGFTGLKITLNPEEYKHYYLGYAHFVKIEEIE